MDGLVQTAGGGTQGRGRHHANAAGDLAGFVAQNIAKHVLGHNHVKLAGVLADLHGAVVHKHLAVLHFGVLGLQAMHHGTPQAAGIQHVGFIHTGQLFAALHGSFKANAANALDLVLRVGHAVNRNFFAVLLNGFVLAKIHAANQLTHHNKVDAFVHDLFLQRGSIRQLGPDPGRAVVGVQAHPGAQAQQAFFRALVTGHALPLGAANGAKQNGIRGQALVQLALGQGIAKLVNGFAAHVSAGVGKGVAKLFSNVVQHAHCLGHNLRAGAVAINQGNVFLHLTFPPECSSSGRRP